MLKVLSGNCKNIIGAKKTDFATKLIDREYTHFDEPLFCEYQRLLVTDNSPVSIWEKGRQIGYSYSTAFRSVYKASKNLRDTVYMSYNRESAKDYMREIQRWCRIFNLTFSLYEDECISDQNVNIFECTFLNLRKIIAVSGDCTNLRGKPGADIIIDEACYNPSKLDDIMAASMATLIHGGTVRIGSTHAGIDSEFNEMILKCKAGEMPYKVNTVSFKSAIKQGLYKRICAKNKKEWDKEGESKWIDEIYAMYGNRASEELDAIPSDYSVGGKIFNNYSYIDLSEYPVWDIIRFRYHDLAASEDKDDKNESACFSASVRMAFVISTETIVIDDWQAEKLSPLEGDRNIIDLSLEDGEKVTQLIEQEPGSTGLKYVAYMQERLAENGIYLVEGYRPKLEKIKRAIPAGNAIQTKKLVIDKNMKYREKFTSLLTKFSNKKQPLITDLADCVSGCYDYITTEYNWL